MCIHIPLLYEKVTCCKDTPKYMQAKEMQMLHIFYQDMYEFQKIIQLIISKCEALAFI